MPFFKRGFLGGLEVWREDGGGRAESDVLAFPDPPFPPPCPSMGYCVDRRPSGMLPGLQEIATRSGALGNLAEAASGSSSSGSGSYGMLCSYKKGKGKGGVGLVVFLKSNALIPLPSPVPPLSNIGMLLLNRRQFERVWSVVCVMLLVWIVWREHGRHNPPPPSSFSVFCQMARIARLLCWTPLTTTTLPAYLT